MNLLDRFQKNIIGNQKNIFDYIGNLSPSGDFTKIEGIDVVLESWTNILLTPMGTYDHDPQYGSKLYSYIFEPLDDNTKIAIEDEVKYRLSIYESRAQVKKINVNYLRDRKGFEIQIEVKFNGSISKFKLDSNKLRSLLE